MLFEKISLDVKEQSSNGFGILGVLAQLILINVENAAKIAEQCLGIEGINIWSQLVIEVLLGVILIIDITDNLLKHVFKCGDALSASILIDDNGHVHLLGAEIL